MKRSFHKIVFWGCALTVYALLVATVSSLLRESKSEYPVAVSKDLAAAIAGADHNFSAVLLPLGPDDSRLPGLSGVWQAFPSAGGIATTNATGNGYDGLQAVAQYTDFSRNAVAELFLAGVPKQVFRLDRQLLLLSDRGVVQIIDCEYPRAPKISGILPYEAVKHMEMRDGIAYLLCSSPGDLEDVMLIADLSKPGAPRELARFDMPRDAMSFYISDTRLVVSANPPDRTGVIYLFDLTDDYRLVSLGSTSSTLLNKGFVKFADYLLVPDLRTGVHVCDFTDPLQPVVVASLAFPATARQFARHGETAFVLDDQQRIHVIDLQDPLQPVLSAVVENARYPAFFIGHDDVTYYFTLQGYLHVIPMPHNPLNMRGPEADGLAGELIALRNDGGFTLLGADPGALPEGVANVLLPAYRADVIDAALWQQGVAILHEDGLVSFFRQSDGPAPEFQGSVQLADRPRWLAAGGERLYAGGKSTISVIACDSEQLTVTGQLALPGVVSWDGLVVRKTLCVAAGRDGFLSFSLDEPDRPSANPPWELPRHLEALFDVRQLLAAEGGRLLAAAGRAGLVDGRIDARGQFRLNGLLAFEAPVTALAIINQLVLAATTEDVRVVDLSTEGSLQNLGQIAFSGIERLAVAPPAYWAGYVAGQGWSVLAAPRLLPRADYGFLQCVGATEVKTRLHIFRLNLYNDQYIKTFPGFVHLPRPAASRMQQAGRHGN